MFNAHFVRTCTGRPNTVAPRVYNGRNRQTFCFLIKYKKKKTRVGHAGGRSPLVYLVRNENTISSGARASRLANDLRFRAAPEWVSKHKCARGRRHKKMRKAQNSSTSADIQSRSLCFRYRRTPSADTVLSSYFLGRFFFSSENVFRNIQYHWVGKCAFPYGGAFIGFLGRPRVTQLKCLCLLYTRAF